jgi:hypothetical protein
MVPNREEYIQKTLLLADNSSSEGYRAKYWELAGKALGFLEPERRETNNIAIFQSISGEMIAFLKEKVPSFRAVSDCAQIVDEKQEDSPNANDGLKS